MAQNNCLNEQEIQVVALKSSHPMYNTSCNIVGDTGLYDDDEKCPGWADVGECAKNPNYMLVYCKKSCCGNV